MIEYYAPGEQPRIPGDQPGDGDLVHAIAHATVDTSDEDADGYVNWSGRARDVMNTSDPMEVGYADR